MLIAGVSALFHDSAAALVQDGQILAAAHEEVFTRRKHDPAFPRNALDFCLSQIPEQKALDAIVYYEDPALSLDRVIQNALHIAPAGGDVWAGTMSSVLGQKANIGARLRSFVGSDDQVHFVQHHLSHAASAFYPSAFKDAAILIADGVGEWATTTIAHGQHARITPMAEINYPHSLGLLYSAFTEFCGLKVNSGEYKLMGLAPYGRPNLTSVIYDNLIDVRPDGSFRLNLEYFGFPELRNTINPNFGSLFKCQPVPLGGQLKLRHMDVAASIQAVVEDIVCKLASTALKQTGSDNLCMAGGVALNCVANGKILQTVPGLKRLWVQPASGDAGGALGAALYHYHMTTGHARKANPSDNQRCSFLGPEFTPNDIRSALEKTGLVWAAQDQKQSQTTTVAIALSDGAIIGRFTGRTEFGPRALGNRSILADPRREDAQSTVNLRIKFREGWRPFAVAVLADHASQFFGIEDESPYMLLVADILERYRKPVDWNTFRSGDADLQQLANQPASDFAGITHVDYSSRIQSVDQGRNPAFFDLLNEFNRLTGCPMLINTSFNVRGEPLVNTPQDAIDCFLNTDLDALWIGDFLVWKQDQSEELRSRVGTAAYEPD